MIEITKITRAFYDEKANKTILTVELEGNRTYDLERQRAKIVEVRIDDGRTIRTGQRKKAYATINDISDYTGHHPEFLKEYFKYDLIAKTGIEYFSLSDCTVSTAREYITNILDFALDWGIPLSESVIARAEDISRAIYKCLATRTCVISGQPGADIHHVLGSRVGMGRNRKKVDHSTLELIPLSREWHTRVHAEGEEKIFEQFKIYGIVADAITLKKLGITVKEIKEDEKEVKERTTA